MCECNLQLNIYFDAGRLSYKKLIVLSDVKVYILLFEALLSSYCSTIHLRLVVQKKIITGKISSKIWKENPSIFVIWLFQFLPDLFVIQICFSLSTLKDSEQTILKRICRVMCTFHDFLERWILSVVTCRKGIHLSLQRAKIIILISSLKP